MANANKLGALWKKTLKSGVEILSGSVTVGDTTVRVTCWPIAPEAKAENPKRPDYNVVEDNFTPRPRSERDYAVTPPPQEEPSTDVFTPEDRGF